MGRLDLNVSMPSLDQQRQQDNVAFIASGSEFSFGAASDCPLPLDQLRQLHANSPGVEALMSSGLTAVVLRLRVGTRCFAIKKARQRCLVQNLDGQTSFLNELHRHAELRALRETGVDLPGVVAPVYGSLRHGMVVAPWIDGQHPTDGSLRPLTQLLSTGCQLLEHGFFEWDFCAGNLLDDGAQLWLFDFGYMYRFDPLTQFNSAGDGTNCPRHHLAERIEGRYLFGNLLRVEQHDGLAAAVEQFVAFKRLALQAYIGLHTRLVARGASELVLAHYQALITSWTHALSAHPRLLYLRDGWCAHSSDLDDDLHGQSCTARTLQRADWLLDSIQHHHGALLETEALSPSDRQHKQHALHHHYQAKRERARAYLMA